MEDLNKFGGEPEAGYGRNDNGTDMNRDDYMAGNPDTSTDAYDDNIRQAELEEEAEVRALYPDDYGFEKSSSASEAIARARMLMEEMDKALDSIEREIKGSKALSENVKAEKLGDVDAAGSKVANRDLDRKMGDTAFTNSEGLMFGSAGEALDSDPNRRDN